MNCSINPVKTQMHRGKVGTKSHNLKTCITFS